MLARCCPLLCTHRRRRLLTYLPCPPPTGAPAATRNIFCDPATDTCFNLTTTVKSFDDAATACAAMTGRLVTYQSAAKQLMVEQVGHGAGRRSGLADAFIGC